MQGRQLLGMQREGRVCTPTDVAELDLEDIWGKWLHYCTYLSPIQAA